MHDDRLRQRHPRAFGELCDDHNTQDGDGCDSNCTPTGCGNGIITGAEICDDGNTAAGDGCSDTCMKEPGWNCTAGNMTTCTAICGDGMIVGPETCDDMNTDPSDGCNNCMFDAGCATGETAVVLHNTTSVPIPDDDVDTGATSTVTVTPTGAITKLSVIVDQLTHTYDADVLLKLEGPGARRVSLLTQNNGDDGDNYTGTWFRDDAAALIDTGASPFTGKFMPDESLSTTNGTDFKGTKAAGTWTLHAYDDSSADTGSVDAWTLVACVDTAAGYCGDGHTDPGEECDDGNTDNTDACKNNCKLPCGDGILDPGEQCDDGNHTSNDGCSATCMYDCPTGSTLVTGTQATSVAITDTDDGSGVDSINSLPTSGGVTKMHG